MSAKTGMRRSRDTIPFVAFGLVLVASLGLLLAPLGEREGSCSVTANSGQAATTQPGCEDRTTHVSLLQQEGGWVLFVAAVPVLVAAVPLGLRRTRWRRNAALVAGTLLVAFSVVGAASIGLFYLPGAVAMFMAATNPGRRPAPA
jgi:hypothetical protein